LVAPVPSSARCGLAVVAGEEDQLVMLERKPATSCRRDEFTTYRGYEFMA